MSTNTKLVIYVAIAIAALGTTVITTTAMTQVAYADDNNGIGNDFTKDGEKGDEGNQGLGNSYTSELDDDHDKGIGNDEQRDHDEDDKNQGIGNDIIRHK